MLDLTNENPEICILGRTDFTSGIGIAVYCCCELLARNFPVSIYPLDRGTKKHSNSIRLPNGRILPICRNFKNIKVFFYADILWNGEYDLHYTLIPKHGLRIAGHLPLDSDLFPAKWVEILNHHFDVAYVTSKHIESVARKSGVKIPLGTLPVALDIDKYLARPVSTFGYPKMRFGSIAAFHPRKNIDILVKAFIKEFKNNNNIELILHSNAKFGETYNEIKNLIKFSQTKNIIISHKNINEDEKLKLLESIDIFINCSKGEGFSSGAREALALGKVLVLSEIGPHKDLENVHGVFMIPPTIAVPARYPEIDNLICGYQYSVTVANVQKALRDAYQYVVSGQANTTTNWRKAKAHEFSFSRLSTSYAETISPDIAQFKSLARRSSFTRRHKDCSDIARQKLGPFDNALSTINRTIIPAHDGGFFSVFNIFISHLVCDSYKDRCHLVLPDWDVSRLLSRKQSGDKMVSFCYGKPEDGNIWLKLFKPLYGLSPEQMNNEHFLYHKSSVPDQHFNELREPLLTYINAYDLYCSPTFKNFRKQYNKFFKTHVHLLPELQKEINSFIQSHFTNSFILAAHVKHPSHMIEQPEHCIANGQAFIDSIQNRIKQLENKKREQDWKVFLATDQDRVVQQFQTVFGNKLIYYPDVRRTKIQEDEFYDQLSNEEKAKEGYQVQHLVAANPENWNIRMAWEVLRDTITMSQCNVLFHVVSNVSTAVSYMNPEIEMHYMN